MMNKIDFIAVDFGKIELFSGDELVVASDDANVLADAALAVGGFAPVVNGSSTVDFADEYGFATQLEFDLLWKKVCEYVSMGV